MAPAKAGWAGLEDGPPLSYKSKLLRKPRGDTCSPEHVFIKRISAVCLLSQNIHGQDTVFWVPEEQARDQVTLHPANSQPLCGLCWAAGRCLRVSDLPGVEMGSWHWTQSTGRCSYPLISVITLDLGSRGGWGKCAWSWGLLALSLRENTGSY